MAARRNRRQEVYRKRLLSRRYKTREIKIVSRKGQPQITAEVRKLKPQAGIGGPVSSSWIAALFWPGQWARMELIKGGAYHVYCPFEVFERWYYAHSKGTFFNYEIKDKYQVVQAL